MSCCFKRDEFCISNVELCIQLMNFVYLLKRVMTGATGLRGRQAEADLRVRLGCCLLCICMPAIDRSLE